MPRGLRDANGRRSAVRELRRRSHAMCRRALGMPPEEVEQHLELWILHWVHQSDGVAAPPLLRMVCYVYLPVMGVQQ